MAAERQHHAVGLQQAGVGVHTGDGATAHLQRIDARVPAEPDPQSRRHFCEPIAELEAVAGFVVRQAQGADELFLRQLQRRLDLAEAFTVQHFKRHTVLFEHRDITANAIELLLGAKELQRALRAVVVGDARLGTQCLHAVAAVLGNRHHAALVQRIGLLRAVGQHQQGPAPHGGVEHRPDDQRRMLHQHPLDGLDGHARPGPRRAVAGRHLTGVAEAGFQRRAALAVHQFDFVAGSGQVVSRGHTDHTTTEHQNFHAAPPFVG